MINQGNRMIKTIVRFFTVLGLLLLIACSSSNNDSNSETGNEILLFSISGNLTGLQGSVTLQNNGAESLTLNGSGSFSFSTQVAKGFTYNITVVSQPSGQFCDITNGSGTVDTSPINDITIICTSNRYSVGGTVTGLTGDLTLNNNGSDSLVLNASGDFIFSNQLLNAASYVVTVEDQPDTQTCSVIDGDGVIDNAPVDNINVTCVTNTFSVGGLVSGLTGNLTIQNNGGSDLIIAANGPYVFPQELSVNGLYNVQINQNPVAQLCSISNASGQITNVDVNNVDIVCTANNLTVSLSGSYQAAPLIRADSDLNDPNAVANADNGTFNTAQLIPNFSTVHGFATASATGRTLEGDRFASSTDVFDIYRVSLQQNQTLRLQVVDYAGLDTFQGDLDLGLYDLAFNVIGFSNSVSEFESITVPANGEYYIVVDAYCGPIICGASKYTLSIGGVTGLNLANSGAASFMPGEAIIQLKHDSVSASSVSSVMTALKSSVPSLALSHQDTKRVAKAQFEIGDNNQNSATLTLSLGFEQSLARDNPASYRKYKTLKQIKRLNQRADVEFAEPNYLYQPLRVPNDQFYPLQWHYPAINLPQAWDITTGSRSGTDVIVAVIDTGVFLSHPEFAGQLVNGYDFISNAQSAADGGGIDDNPDDPGDASQISNSSWHGTHVAGTVAALSDNNSRVAGVAWDAKIMPIRALGIGGGTGYDIIQSVRFAAGLSNDSNTLPAQKADIINLSLGGGGFSQSSQNAFNAARDAGVIVVAAAGNNNSGVLFYPASYDNVISVSATDLVNNRAPYSNFGARVDVAAPGGSMGVDLNNDGNGDGVLSTLVDASSGNRVATLEFYQGTSMATPHIAGVLALMRAVHPGLTPGDVDSLLSSGTITTDLGDTGRDDIFGFGLIDALKAVQAAQQLANGGSSTQPALIVATPSQLTLGLSSSATIMLSNQGDLQTNITSVSTDASWLSISSITVDSNGLGSYQVSVNRNGLATSTYVGSLTFSLANGSSVNVQVSMLVGSQNSAGELGTIYVLLLDTDYNFIDQVFATDQGNGVFGYSFNNVPAGSYRIIAGSDIDNDLFICQLAEACGAYPTFDSQDIIEVVNANIVGLDYVIDILANFGTGSLSEGNVQDFIGFKRRILNFRQVKK